MKRISRTSRATRCKLRNRVPIVACNAFANDTFAAVHVRGKQVSLCYIVLIDVSYFAAAAAAAIVCTRRVDDQEKPDFLTSLRDSRSRSENFTHYHVSMRQFCHVPIHVLPYHSSIRKDSKKHLAEIVS